MAGAFDPDDTVANAILLVEDENAIREIEAFLLQNKGYAVLSAGSIHRAEQLFEENRETVRLLLTDLVLPDGSGIELHYKLTKIKQDLITLMVSGSQPDPGQIPLGVDFLKKPFTMTELNQKIVRAMGRSNNSDENPPPVCGLTHRFPVDQTDLFAMRNSFSCCDSRDCPYRKVHHRRKYCLYPEVIQNQEITKED